MFFLVNNDGISKIGDMAEKYCQKKKKRIVYLLQKQWKTDGKGD